MSLICEEKSITNKTEQVQLGARHAHFEGLFHEAPPLLEVNGLERIWLDVSEYELY